MNLLLPFRRGPRDFAAGDGDALLRSMLEQVLGTEPGELPWRTAFGVGLEGLRHTSNDAALAELIRVRVRAALRDWLPGAELVRCDCVRAGATLEVRLETRLKGRILQSRVARQA